MPQVENGNRGPTGEARQQVFGVENDAARVYECESARAARDVTPGCQDVYWLQPSFLKLSTGHEICIWW